MGADVGADDCRDHGWDGQLYIDQMITGEAVGGKRGAKWGRHLIGGNSRMGRQSGDQIGGKGNQPATSSDGVYHAGQEDKGAYDDKGMYC